MTIQSGAVLNTQGFGNRPENVEIPHVDVRNPSSLDTGRGFFPIGKRWINRLISIFGRLTFGSSGPDVFSGSGSSSGLVKAPKGSLYLNTPGSAVNDRAFINTNNVTAWTAIVTTS